jgi:hypothetical protein
MSKPGTDTVVLTPPDADGIAIVTLDHFPVNSLSRAVTNRDAINAGGAEGPLGPLGQTTP